MQSQDTARYKSSLKLRPSTRATRDAATTPVSVGDMGSGRDRSLVISVQVTWLCWSATPRLGSARMRSFVCHQRAAKCQHAHHHPHFRRGTADDFHALCVYAPLTVIVHD